MRASRLGGGRGLYIDGGRDCSLKPWTLFIIQSSLDAIRLLYTMDTVFKSMMDAVPPTFNAGRDFSSSNVVGRCFSNDDTGRDYSYSSSNDVGRSCSAGDVGCGS